MYEFEDVNSGATGSFVTYRVVASFDGNGNGIGSMVASSTTAPLVTGQSFTYSVSNGQGMVLEDGSVLASVEKKGTLTKNFSVAVRLGVLPEVKPLFPNNGANWNDYVTGKTALSASDTACNAATDTACVHGGETRVVTVKGQTSCSGLTASDMLGLFDWTCDASTGSVRFISTGLQQDKFLSDLIDWNAVAWKANSVIVQKNGLVFAGTPMTKWWSNPFSNANSGGFLPATGTIYVIDINPTTTYTLMANKVALVMKPGLLITGSTTTGETLVSAYNTDFMWFEGFLDAAGDDIGVFWNHVRYSTLRNVGVLNADTGYSHVGVWLDYSSHNRVWRMGSGNTLSSGLELSFSDYNDIRHVRCAQNSTVAQVMIRNSNYNYFDDIVAVQSQQIGIDILQSNRNIITNVTANNNHSENITLDSGSSDNILLNMVAANSSGNGILAYSNNNIIANYTAVNNSSQSVALRGGVSNLLLSGLSVNNGYGFHLASGADSNRLVNTVSANDSSWSVTLSSVSNNAFSGLLKLGGWCTVTGGTNPGLVDSTCANNGSSNAVLTIGIDATASFVSKVTSTDTENTSNASGAAQFQNINDWLQFNNSFRMWGLEGTAAFPDSSNRGYCGQGGATEICRIYDWSLATGDTGDHGAAVALGVLPVPTGRDTLTHTWSDATTVTFLKNAVELSGNGNGLCESGETCLYTPNIGAYQGHGSLISAGTFTNGTITGVTLMKYESNGR